MKQLVKKSAFGFKMFFFQLFAERFLSFFNAFFSKEFGVNQCAAIGTVIQISIKCSAGTAFYDRCRAQLLVFYKFTKISTKF